LQKQLIFSSYRAHLLFFYTYFWGNFCENKYFRKNFRRKQIFSQNKYYLWTSAKISCHQHIFTWFLCFTCCCQVLLFCSKLKDKSTLPKSQVIKIFHKMVSLFHMLLTSLAFLSIRKNFRYFRKLSVSAVIKKNRFTWFSSTSKQKRWNSIAQNSEWRISFYGLKNIHLLRPKVKYRYVYPTSPPPPSCSTSTLWDSKRKWCQTVLFHVFSVSYEPSERAGPPHPLSLICRGKQTLIFSNLLRNICRYATQETAIQPAL
jgi:hypothetical protein